MPKNTFTFDPKTGSMKALSNLQISFTHLCECGYKIAGTMEWPEGLISTGSVSISDVKCPQCAQPVLLPRAEYYAEEFELRYRPIPEENP
ncbi:MAG TPA: hypothetical protein VE934_12105 [Polaromonas sp.]|uniref:hypothetical protein n=1 Tax=Polaromonas sp. TaxID=1869339 RepID=UPI002D30F48F|nr:hypothetical protein [Polaromonas sp.]HYW57699.1 hypothetical protein [Polaromonas sp.]